MTRQTWATLTDAHKTELERRYVAGETTNDLSYWLGVDATTIGNWLKKLGVKMRPKGGTARGSHIYGSAVDPTSRGALVSPASIMGTRPMAENDPRRWM